MICFRPSGSRCSRYESLAMAYVKERKHKTGSRTSLTKGRVTGFVVKMRHKVRDVLRSAPKRILPCFATIKETESCATEKPFNRKNILTFYS